MTTPTFDDIARFNKRGQRLGTKGIATRTAIMDATLMLLRSVPLWQITPSDIAESCRIQQPNFYTYFDSIEEVVLALAHRAATEAPDFRDFPADMAGEEGLQWLKRVVEAYIVAWQCYGPALRIVEMLADDDVPEFRKARRRRLTKMHDTLMAVITGAQAAGTLPDDLNARLVGYSVLSLIRVTAEHYNLTRTYPMSHDEIVTTNARMAQLLLTGQTAAANTKKPSRVKPATALKVRA